MTRSIVLFAAASGIVLTPAAVANHIDLMTDGVFSVSNDTMIVTGDPEEILGGMRLAETNFVNSVLTRNASDSFTTFTNNSGFSSTATLDYGDFAGGNGELNADFDTEWNFVAVDILAAQGSGLMRLAFESDAGEGLSGAVAIAGPGTYFFAFSDAGYSEVDFTDIDRVTLTILAANGGEFEIGAITRTAVPAPGAMGVLAGAGLIVLRRRR